MRLLWRRRCSRLCRSCRRSGRRAVTVVVVEPTGSEVQLIGRTAGGEEIVANFRERHSFTPGETIRLTAEPGLIHLFHGETGQRIKTRTEQ